LHDLFEHLDDREAVKLTAAYAIKAGG